MTGEPETHSPMTDREQLAHGYSPVFRALDTLSIVAFAVLSAVLARAVGGAWWLHLCFGLIGPPAADVLTGSVHWAADTWGTVHWRVVGPMFIRTFREHHVDQLAITRHDFVETNGANAMVALPMMVGAALWGQPVVCAAVLWLCLWAMATNQFHKWAHSGDNVPAAVRFLHKHSILLTPRHHALHHQAPYLSNYCITGGWMNPLLDGIGFFRRMERIITALTGAVPRAEDHRLTEG